MSSSLVIAYTAWIAVAFFVIWDVRKEPKEVPDTAERLAKESDQRWGWAAIVAEPDAKKAAPEDPNDAKHWYQARRQADWTRVAAVAAVTAFVISVLGTIFAYRSWQTSIDTEERSLRAYISVASGKDDKGKAMSHIDWNPGPLGKTPEGWVTFRNSGQTPAYDVKVRVGVSVERWPLSALFNFPILAANPQPTLEPHGVTSTSQAARIILNVPDDWRLGHFGVYIYGTLIYRDAFSYEHWFNYCMYFISYADPGTYCNTHNDSDDSRNAYRN